VSVFGSIAASAHAVRASLICACKIAKRIGFICFERLNWALPKQMLAEATVWHDDVNTAQRVVEWQMRIDDARCKLKSVYPKIKL
jgi:hypothetical protein